MEIKVHKEVRNYHESIVLGLSMRQLLCAIGAVVVAVAVYFLLREPLGKETVSWLCIVAAAPLAVAGFFTYHGLTLEKLVWAWLRTNVLSSQRRVFQSVNYYEISSQQKGRKRKGEQHGHHACKKGPSCK